MNKAVICRILDSAWNANKKYDLEFAYIFWVDETQQNCHLLLYMQLWEYFSFSRFYIYLTGIWIG